MVQVSTEGVEQLETYFGKYLPQLFYSLIAPGDAIYYFVQSQLKSKRDSADLCAADSDFYRGGAEDRKEVIKQVLEHLYRFG